ncbi:hypothetical protein BDD43_2785 [Mucilaginibacter gracilis]|uniref:Uncharacterized protein n=1 Tax=Mucilaginibacter gracilis TaxID=423350 RepID=A0A495J0V9_9SPHI|nr:hypothetical protein [Mucilaginibacter gracilis]RKR82600.1 hypothetical protein BDD43_2785 [Mucilaginibacter gracilis]
MSKHTEKLRKQLLEISEVVNAFRSEAVQVKIIDRLLDSIMDGERHDTEGDLSKLQERRNRKFISSSSEDDGADSRIRGRKKPGATKILNQIIHTDFFDVPRSIAGIANYCKEQFDSDFKTSELSGILLKLSNEHKLKRERNNENNRFDYVKY